MGDSRAQARLMSRALRKMTGALNNSGTTASSSTSSATKIGVMFGVARDDLRAEGVEVLRVVRMDGVQQSGTLKDGTNAVGSAPESRSSEQVPRGSTRIFDRSPGTTHRIEDVVDGRKPVVSWRKGRNAAVWVSWFDQGTRDNDRVADRRWRHRVSAITGADKLRLACRRELRKEDRVAQRDASMDSVTVRRFRRTCGTLAT